MISERDVMKNMPFSQFEYQTKILLLEALDGAMLVLEATKSDAIAEGRRAETFAILTSRLIIAAVEGINDFESLQMRALDGLYW